MLFRNFTPFPPLQFESRDEQRRDFGVVVLRGTFAIRQGEGLRLIPEQAPLVMADEYFGEPGTSSLRFESNLAPYKPNTDIHIIATAHAPGGRPATEWPVQVEIGKLRKELLITGPRFWKAAALRGWSLSDPIPIAQLPIRYEQAYGGFVDASDPESSLEENPIGTGHQNPRLLDPSKPIPAPQILPLGTRSLEIGKPFKVEGLGPISPAWQPRRSKAGTFDSIWEKTRWPDLPEDFKFDFYNSSHPDLIYPGFVLGEETIRLVNLHSISPLTFNLPAFQLALLMRFEDGQIVPAPVQLDTIHLDVPELRAFLVWRAVFPLSKPLRVLEVRMRIPDSYQAEVGQPDDSGLGLPRTVA